MLLTLADVGKSHLRIAGPRHTSHFLEACRYFLRRPDFKVDVLDFLRTSTEVDRQPFFEDENLSVFPIVIHSSQEPHFDGRYPLLSPESPEMRGFLRMNKEIDPMQRGFASFSGALDDPKSTYDPEECTSESSPRRRSPSPPKDPSRSKLPCTFQTLHASSAVCCYAFHTPTVRGKFDQTKAKALGIPPGPSYSQLIRGDPVMNKQGRTVLPSEVISADILGSVVLVVKCPSEHYLNSLTKSPVWKSYQQDGTHANQVAALYHFSSPETLASPIYQEWLDQFPEHVKVRQSLLSDTTHSIDLSCSTLP
jgi:hypothetical protein